MGVCYGPLGMSELHVWSGSDVLSMKLKTEKNGMNRGGGIQGSYELTLWTSSYE